MSTTPPQARLASVHWLRFPRVVTPDDLSLTQSPEACLSWKGRTSFTRFRILETRGRWNGSDPFELAGGAIS